MKNREIFSQNVIKNRDLISKLVEQSGINQNDTVLEIGGGTGNITRVLAEKSGNVIVHEIDPNFVDKLKAEFLEKPSVHVINADFLTSTLPTSKYKVFANIPFRFSSAILKRLITSKTPPVDIFLIVQKEFFERVKGIPNETLFSLSVKPTYEIKAIHKFSIKDFSPEPGVEIVLMHLHLLDIPSVKRSQITTYLDFLAYVLNSHKSNIGRALENVFTMNQLSRLSKDLNFSMKSRPTELDFTQWIGLYNYFLSGVEQKKKRIISGANIKLKQSQKGMVKLHKTRIHGSMND